MYKQIATTDGTFEEWRKTWIAWLPPSLIRPDTLCALWLCCYFFLGIAAIADFGNADDAVAAGDLKAVVIL